MNATLAKKDSRVFQRDELWADPRGNCWSVIEVRGDGQARLRNGPLKHGGRDVLRDRAATEGWTLDLEARRGQ